jgi:hypothetical protein
VSSGLVQGMASGLTRNVAFTDPSAEDEMLRGRTYPIPFDDVWKASLGLVGGGLRRWELREADDQEGVIRGTARGLVDRLTSAITVRITLDYNAQTRVDALSAFRVGRADFGINRRRLIRFFKSLDDALARGQGHPVHTVQYVPAAERDARSA